MTAGDKIKTAREKAGMTQQQLANITGIPRVNIRKFESGEWAPSPPTLRKIMTSIDSIMEAAAITEAVQTDAPPAQPDFSQMRDKEVLRWQLGTLARKSAEIRTPELCYLVPISETMIKLYHALAE